METGHWTLDTGNTANLNFALAALAGLLTRGGKTALFWRTINKSVNRPAGNEIESAIGGRDKPI